MSSFMQQDQASMNLSLPSSSLSTRYFYHTPECWYLYLISCFKVLDRSALKVNLESWMLMKYDIYQVGLLVLPEFGFVGQSEHGTISLLSRCCWIGEHESECRYTIIISTHVLCCLGWVSLLISNGATSWSGASTDPTAWCSCVQSPPPSPCSSPWPCRS